MIVKQLLVLLWIGSALSCEKQGESIQGYAEVIGFSPDKCMCCWGWTIKMGNDTIKSDNIIIGETIGFDFEKPVPVLLKLGEKDTRCTSYYDIIKIEKIK